MNPTLPFTAIDWRAPIKWGAVLSAIVHGLALLWAVDAPLTPPPLPHRLAVELLAPAAPAAPATAPISPILPIPVRPAPPPPERAARPPLHNAPAPLMSQSRATPATPLVPSAPVAPIDPPPALPAAPAASHLSAVTPREPAPPTDKPLADSSWLSNTVWQLMNTRKRYPLMARRMGLEGRVVVEAVINERGQLLSAEIKQSSGHALLDQDALKLLQSITPLSIDSHRLGAATRVQIPVGYVLE